MRDLHNNPLWQTNDLGKPLPDDPHAVSVALPLWEHVVGYEEADPAILDRLQCGYPRFFVHPLVKRLFAEAESNCAGPGERLMLLPSRPAVERAASYIERVAGVQTRITEAFGCFAVIMPEAGWEAAMKYWRFCGEIVSSRRAEAVLADRVSTDEGDAQAAEAKRKIRSRLAELAGQSEDDVFLFPSGIAAVYAAQRLAAGLNPDRKTVQIEFPYVDVLKVQEEFEIGVEFIPNCAAGGVPGVQQLLAAGRPPAGVFCEIPSNPQLRTADLAGLASILQPIGIPLVVDDTIATVINVDCFQHADVVTTSLTKFFSGAGDVLAGSLILNRESPLYDRMAVILREIYVDDFWADDALVLERNSRDFAERIPKINSTTEAVFDFLADHPAIEQIWYPKTATRGFYDAIRREGSGFGGLFSILLHDPKRNAPRFHDALQISKGPSLGTNFTLACPYMLLAHYPELDWSDALGIDRHLVRFSIGLEEPSDLVSRIESALSRLGS
ncbi:MAG: cystathionine gamma-synthase [Verrucomicrobiales bacterium]|jgi:cystathionine gamma-synthase